MTIKLKTLLKEDTEKLWAIYFSHPRIDEPGLSAAVKDALAWKVGFTKATSEEEALDKFYNATKGQDIPQCDSTPFCEGEKVSESNRNQFTAKESNDSELSEYKKRWKYQSEKLSGKYLSAQNSLKNADIK